MIIAGEASGELYGALLTKAIRQLWPRVKIVGVGGEKMREAGVLLFAEITSAFGFFEAISAFRRVKKTFDTTVEMMKKIKPNVIVLIDYPDFNLRLAKVARKMGIKILYYVSPQVWAWRKGRLKTIGRLVDKMAVILPFEEELYKSRAIPCEFVGHPIIEEIRALKREYAREELGIGEADKVISILPGSRTNELDRLLPVLLEFVKAFKRDCPQYKIILPVASSVNIEKYALMFELFEREGVQIIYGGSLHALAVSEMAVIASGTATLQSVLIGTPTIVIYKVSPFSYILAKMIVRVKFISLVNLIFGREVVKELIQGAATAENILKEVKKIQFNEEYRNKMKESFNELLKIYENKNPSLRVGEIIGEVAGWKS